MLREMSGWTVTAPKAFAEELVRRGARLGRATHRMTCDLSVRRPPAEWANPALPSPLRFESFDRSIDDLLPAWRAAYAPGHPDHRQEYDDDSVLRDRFGMMVAGAAFGALSSLSCVVCDSGAVVAGLVLNHVPGKIPWGGPFITDLFRHPSYPGTGTALLRRTLTRAAASDLRVVGLVVTDTNPALRVYTRHGFEVFDSPVTVTIP
ncbi:hypothetical protein AORI_5351 [Amycolatopsis keratiniphila]|uniref:N-acetyltransferase domain-containing protein n=1 Tax=Amycolatopsis keratiniphila TaxID=129921 RepID=R4SX91_9PSEU|nr:hypothetical protein AORI_5351 [Amycolatopsis keratiniphila]